MAAWVKCKTCGEYDSSHASHTCSPIWLVQEVEIVGPLGVDEHEWSDVRAVDAEDAAEKWGKRWDRDEYEMLSGYVLTVVVRREVLLGEDDEDRLFFFDVRGEAEPTYSATQLAPPDVAEVAS